jgi:hypothetical protein
MSETLPSVFAVQFIGDRWLSVAPSDGARGTFERRELRMVDGDALTVVSGDAKKIHAPEICYPGVIRRPF